MTVKAPFRKGRHARQLPPSWWGRLKEITHRRPPQSATERTTEALPNAPGGGYRGRWWWRSGETHWLRYPVGLLPPLLALSAQGPSAVARTARPHPHGRRGPSRTTVAGAARSCMSRVRPFLTPLPGWGGGPASRSQKKGCWLGRGECVDPPWNGDSWVQVGGGQGAREGEGRLLAC